MWAIIVTLAEVGDLMAPLKLENFIEIQSQLKLFVDLSSSIPLI